MKQEYKIFTNNEYINKNSQFWKECEDKGIFHLIAITKRLYTRIEWDYYTIKSYHKINDVDDIYMLKMQDKIQKLHNEYKQNVDLPKKQQFESIQMNVGAFYVRVEDVENILTKLTQILNDTLICLQPILVDMEEEIKKIPKLAIINSTKV